MARSASSSREAHPFGLLLWPHSRPPPPLLQLEAQSGANVTARMQSSNYLGTMQGNTMFCKHLLLFNEPLHPLKLAEGPLRPMNRRFQTEDSVHQGSGCKVGQCTGMWGLTLRGKDMGQLVTHGVCCTSSGSSVAVHQTKLAASKSVQFNVPSCQLASKEAQAAAQLGPTLCEGPQPPPVGRHSRLCAGQAATWQSRLWERGGVQQGGMRGRNVTRGSQKGCPPMSWPPRGPRRLPSKGQHPACTFPA